MSNSPDKVFLDNYNLSKENYEDNKKIYLIKIKGDLIELNKEEFLFLWSNINAQIMAELLTG